MSLTQRPYFWGGGLMKNDPAFVSELKDAVDNELGKYYRDVPIMRVADRTVEWAPIALPIYETMKRKKN